MYEFLCKALLKFYFAYSVRSDSGSLCLILLFTSDRQQKLKQISLENRGFLPRVSCLTSVPK